MRLFPVLVFLTAVDTSGEWLSCVILMLTPEEQIKKKLHWKRWVQNLSCKNKECKLQRNADRRDWKACYQLTLHLVWASLWVPALRRDVVFVACFPSNRRFFNEILANQELFCEVTLLASLETKTLTTEIKNYQLKGAVSRQSSSFCLILSITRPQSLWNLK